MNNQEAFDTMVTHLFTQKAQALSPHGACEYKTLNGKKCAVGALIPDDQYSEEFEGSPVGDIVDNIPALKGLDLTILTAVQITHDEYDPAHWFAQLQGVCDRFSLDNAALNTFIGVI